MKIINLKKNLGAARARNMAFKKAKGDYIAITDADVVVPENWLSELLKHIEGYDFIFAPSYLVHNGNLAGYLQEGKNEPPFTNPNNSLYKRKVLDEEPYSEDFPYCGYEDVDMRMRQEKRFKHGLVKKPGVKHFHGETNRSYIKRGFKIAQPYIAFRKRHPSWKSTAAFFMYLLSPVIPFPLIFALRQIKGMGRACKLSKSYLNLIPFYILEVLRFYAFSFGLWYHLLRE
jgi:glycosyltransferase involved in cell wall biosynthesis